MHRYPTKGQEEDVYGYNCEVKTVFWRLEGKARYCVSKMIQNHRDRKLNGNETQEGSTYDIFSFLFTICLVIKFENSHGNSQGQG